MKDSEGVSVQTGTSFTSGNQTASSPTTNANVLWGAAAAALLGSTLAEWQRRREEEAALLARHAGSSGGDGGNDEEDGGSSNRKNPGRVAYEAKMRQKRIVGESQALLNGKAAREKSYQLYREGERVSVPVNPQTQSNREKLIAKNEDKVPIDMAKVNQLAQNNVDAARWAGAASVAQAKQEAGVASVANENLPKQSWWQMNVLAPLQTIFTPAKPFEPTSTTTKTPTSTFTPSLTPTETVTKTPTATFTPSGTATSTPTVTKTPLPTPTGTPSTETAVDLLKYSPLGQQLYDSLKSEVKLRIKFSDNALNLSAGEIKLDYSSDGAGHMYRDEKSESYVWGLIKTTKVTYKIVVDPRESPTYISGTIAHEIYHHIMPGNTQLEEYNAFLIGDVVRAQIVQAGYGTPSDLRYPLTVYNVNTNNPDLGQLIQDLDQWFKARKGDMPKYVLPKAQGGWGVQPLPTMPTETPTPTLTPTPTQTLSQTPTATPTPTVTQTPTQTPPMQTPTSTQTP